MLMALAKTWAAIPKKDCPGWAALPANQKITLQLGSREDRGALMFWLLPQCLQTLLGIALTPFMSHCLHQLRITATMLTLVPLPDGRLGAGRWNTRLASSPAPVPMPRGEGRRSPGRRRVREAGAVDRTQQVPDTARPDGRYHRIAVGRGGLHQLAA